MKKPISLFIPLLILLSCNNKQENKSANADTMAKQDTLAHLQITVLADLPDSLHPKTILLENMPKPSKVLIPKTKKVDFSTTKVNGEIKKINFAPPVTVFPPLLKDKNGGVIKDKNGDPFILGGGGVSNFTTYNTDNGLPLDVITSSCIDHLGNLWFGTQGGGISRYDGKSFTNFHTSQGLTHNDVYCITEDRSGNIWIGTYGGGASRYDGKSFTTFSTAQGMANSGVYCITVDKSGNLWFGTYEGGVSRYDYKKSRRSCNTNTCKHDLQSRQGLEAHNQEIAKSFTNFTTRQGLVNNTVRSITEDKSGNLWFGTYGGVSRFDGKSFVNFSIPQGLAHHVVYSITEDKSGNLWFSTGGGGVSRYDGKRAGSACNTNTCKHDLRNQQDLKAHNQEIAKSFTNFTNAQGLASNDVRTSIMEAKSGNLWFGSWAGGVSCFDGNGFTSFTTSQGLANNNVRSITEDASGNLWIGTWGGGVSRYGGKSFTLFNTSQGLANNIVYGIIEDRSGNYWFGTEGSGVSRYNGKSFTNFTPAQGLVNDVVTSIKEDRSGIIWIGTYGGISRYDGESFTNFTTAQGLASNNVNSIIEDKSGNLWVGTYGGGVSRFDGKSFTNFTTVQGLATNEVYGITEDKSGNLWFGTNHGGVSCYDGKSFTSFSTSMGMANDVVFSITEDKSGNLWFDTPEGLSLLNAEKRKIIFDKKRNLMGYGDNIQNTIQTFTTSEGLPHNYITQVEEDSDGSIYVGTYNGIAQLIYNGTSWKVARVFTSSTARPIKDVNGGQNGMFIDSKGVIWIATGSEKTALVRFDPKAQFLDKAPNKVILQKIKINGETLNWYSLLPSVTDSTINLQQEIITYGTFLDTLKRALIKKKYGDIKFDSITPFYPLPKNLVLPYRFNNIGFDFIATETSRNAMVHYQYILEGYNKEWSPVTDKTSAEFGNINEGTYTFKLKARSPEGVWSEPVTYTFTVLPPWWRTWWAYTLYVLSFLFALRFFVKWRERNLRIEKEKLERTVEIRTAEVVAEKKEVEKQKQEADRQRDEANQQRERSDELLLNILPEEVAEELKAKGSADAKQFDQVTVMFTDFKGFTQISEKLTPAELVAEIHTCFKAFDNIITKYNIEKIKTIGDSYMCAGGLPVTNTNNPVDVVHAALEIQHFMQEHLAHRKTEHKEPFEIRIGIHTGPVVAGIVGVKKFAYDIWGDTVNTASRMESSGEAGKVNISGSTYEFVKDAFTCMHRGKIPAKNKGEIDMYFVEAENQTI